MRAAAPPPPPPLASYAYNYVEEVNFVCPVSGQVRTYLLVLQTKFRAYNKCPKCTPIL